MNLRLCLQPEGSGNREAGPREPSQNPEVSPGAPAQPGILGRLASMASLIPIPMWPSHPGVLVCWWLETTLPLWTLW